MWVASHVHMVMHTIRLINIIIISIGIGISINLIGSSTSSPQRHSGG